MIVKHIRNATAISNMVSNRTLIGLISRNFNVALHQISMNISSISDQIVLLCCTRSQETVLKLLTVAKPRLYLSSKSKFFRLGRSFKTVS